MWSSQNPSIITGVCGATTVRSMVTVPSKLIYSILIVDSVSLPRSREIPSLGSFGGGITFTAILLSFHLGTVIRDWVSLADGSGANTN